METPNQPIRLALIGPRRSQCGVADYTDYLARALAGLSDCVEIARVSDPSSFAPEVNQADIAHIQFQYHLFGGVAPWKNRFARFAEQLRVPAVLTAHEVVTPAGSLPRRLAIRLVNRRIFRHPTVRRVVVHTAADVQRLASMGVGVERIALVRHGVPDPPGLPPREVARTRLGLHGTFVVTLFGFLSRRKGHLDLINALRALPEDIVAVLAGGRHPDDRSAYESEIHEAIRQAGLGERVRVTGYLPPERVAEVMSATDLVCAPFLESSGSGSLALAVACALPILASDIAPHREIEAESPGTLALFDAANSASLAGAIQLLRGDPERRAQLAAASGAFARERSYLRMARETVTVYRRVLAESGRGGHNRE